MMHGLTHDHTRFGEMDETAADREALILEHLPQVRRIARRIHSRLPSHICLEDLISAGVVGLLAAIENYDASREAQLSTYAHTRIKGAILDSLRQMDYLSRVDRKGIGELRSAMRVAGQQHGRIPTEDEISEVLGVSVERYRELLVALHSSVTVPLQNISCDGKPEDGMLRFLCEDEQSSPERILERSELERLIAVQIAQMPPMERLIITLYYYEDLTLQEIARILDLHHSRIWQLRVQAILRLRNFVDDQWPTARGI